MTRYWKYSATALLALAIFVPAASARPGIVFRGYFGPAYFGPGYYGWYGPGWTAPYGVVPAANDGKVKIDTKMKDAGVYVDGGYAGTVRQLKTFPLHVGTHDIEVRDASGQTIIQEHIDVLAGKTITLSA